MLRRALVTGGAGFIGSHLVHMLHNDGVEVTVIDDLSTGRIAYLPEGVLIHPVDIGSPIAASIIRAGEFDAVFHLAAQIDLRASVEDSQADARNNVLGMLNLLEAVRASRASTRVVFSSSGGAIYRGSAAPPHREDAPKEPDSAYGCAKLSAEHYLRYFDRVHGVQSVSLRYANVYGPRQNSMGDAGVVSVFADRLLRGRCLTIYGDGRQTRDFVYVGDVARANVLAATSPLPPLGDIDARAFNIGCGRETTVLEVASTMRRLANAEQRTIEHEPARLGEVRRSALDASKAVRLLGWSPRTTLEQGLERTYGWFAERESRRAIALYA